MSLNLALFDRAAGVIEERGYWDGHEWTAEERIAFQAGTPVPVCIGLSILKLPLPQAKQEALMEHLANQLGDDGDNPYGFVFGKNDEFKGRPDEGKAWALDTLRKLARGESL